MLKFFVHKYTLSPQVKLNSISGKAEREGALLKIEWPDKKVGYADLFPWPELGDLMLEDQLEGIKKGHLSTLAEQSIWLANRDLKLRAAQKNAVQNLQKIKNHFTIPDYTIITEKKLYELKTAGFSTLKIKVGRDWLSELEWITQVLTQNHFMIRLDFNSNGEFSTIERMMRSLPVGLKAKIEFIEDPFPFDLEAWTEVSKFAPLALDQEYSNVKKEEWDNLAEPLPFRFLVIKPARQDVMKAVKQAVDRNLKIVFTSSMDHALGVVHAACVASEYKATHPNLVMEAGCLTTHLYLPNEFSSRMICQGPYLTQVPGYGIGFDEVLGALSWEPL